MLLLQETVRKLVVVVVVVAAAVVVIVVVQLRRQEQIISCRSLKKTKKTSFSFFYHSAEAVKAAKVMFRGTQTYFRAKECFFPLIGRNETSDICFGQRRYFPKSLKNR